MVLKECTEICECMYTGDLECNPLVCPDNSECKENRCVCSEGFKPDDDGECQGKTWIVCRLEYSYFLWRMRKYRATYSDELAVFYNLLIVICFWKNFNSPTLSVILSTLCFCSILVIKLLLQTWTNAVMMMNCVMAWICSVRIYLVPTPVSAWMGSTSTPPVRPLLLLEHGLHFSLPWRTVCN